MFQIRFKICDLNVLCDKNQLEFHEFIPNKRRHAHVLQWTVSDETNYCFNHLKNETKGQMYYFTFHGRISFHGRYVHSCNLVICITLI